MKPKSELILYQTEDNRTRIEVRLENETVWLTLNQMAELFQRDKSVISKHIKNVFEEGELPLEATVAKYATVQTEGARTVSRDLEFYNLDVIIAVGYRVKSHRGTQFRQWATQRLREYIVKGFVLDDERLKHPRALGGRIISTSCWSASGTSGPANSGYTCACGKSWRWRRITSRMTQETQVFFQTVQNKLHFAVSGKTASELIAARADSAKPNMGLTSWRGAVVRRGDVTVAKNYLNEPEIAVLNRIVTMFLGFCRRPG